jgi:hypothetical protein
MSNPIPTRKTEIAIYATKEFRKPLNSFLNT